MDEELVYVYEKKRIINYTVQDLRKIFVSIERGSRRKRK
jgi:hypothetical protein